MVSSVNTVKCAKPTTSVKIRAKWIFTQQSFDLEITRSNVGFFPVLFLRVGNFIVINGNSWHLLLFPICNFYFIIQIP